MSVTYYVDKMSDTSADTLLAVGFTSLLGAIHHDVYQTMDGVRLVDAGSCNITNLPQPINADNLPSLKDIPLVLPLDSQKQREKKGKKAIVGFDYDGEIERSRVYRALVKELPPELQTPDARRRRDPRLEAILPHEPDTRLGHYQAINQMKIAGSFNELAMRWSELTEQQKQWHVTLLLTLFSSPDNDVMEAIAAWQKYAKEEGITGKAQVTALQIVNPTTGKGANREKANELTIGNQGSFWLLELLKFRGFMEVAAPLVIRESKDRKTYVLQPREIEVGQLQYMMKEFRASFWPSSAVKLDILSSLRFAQILVDQHKTPYRHTLNLWKKRKPLITNIAQGFEVTSYKDLGSAYATMNIATINLPLWLLPMDNLRSIQQNEELLNEHVQLIQGIRNNKGEEGSEEHELLRFYRDFLSGNDLRPLWQFTTTYSSYLMSQHEHEKSTKRWIRQLSYEGLETIIMSEQMNASQERDIITSGESFQRVADAIRRATVFAQYRKGQFDDRTYEVRYGLGQELMRKARHKQEFLIALAQFLVEYNAETAREDEKAARDIANENKTGVRPLTSDNRKDRNLRYMTDEADLRAIEQLVDKHGAELVGSLLVACGYSFKSASSASKKLV